MKMRGNRKCAMMAVFAVGAVAAMPLMANAEISLEKAYEVAGSGRFVNGSNLLIMEGDSGYYLTSMDGQIKSEEIYGRTTENEYGMIIVKQNNGDVNNNGALNQNGQEIIPTKYGDIEVLNDEWALGITLKEATADQYDYENLWGDEAYYLIDTVDVYHVADGAATCLATLPRENIMDTQAYGSYINIQDRATGTVDTYDASFQKVASDVGDIYAEPEANVKLVVYREDGKYGVKDAQGNIVTEPSFSMIGDFRYGYAEVYSDDKRGLIDEQGGVVVEPVYDDIETLFYLPYVNEYGAGYGYNVNGYFAVIQDGKFGYIDSQGNTTMEPKYSESAVEVNGASAILTDLEGNERLLAADGAETVVEGYERIVPLQNGSGLYYRTEDAEYNEGMIDWHGNEIIPCENDDILISGDGKYVLVDADYSDGIVEIYKLPGAETEAPAEETAAAAETEGPVEETAAAAGTEGPAEETAAAAETEVPAEETAAAAETEAPAEETAGAAEMEAPAEETGDTGSAKALLESAATLLDNDSAEIRTSVKILVQQAAAAIGDQNEAAVILLDNVLEMLETEGTDAAGIKGVITSVTALL